MYFSKKFIGFKNVKHCFFSKNGGVSKDIYDSLNCGYGSDDEKKSILDNLSIVSKKMGVDKDNLFLMNQTHSNKVVIIKDNNKNIRRVNSDALVTNQKNVAISVLTADCVPILIYDEINKIIGSIHAGWRGALDGIIENTLNEIININRNAKIKNGFLSINFIYTLLIFYLSNASLILFYIETM